MLFLVKKAETEILVGMMYPLLGRVHHLVGMHKMLVRKCWVVVRMHRLEGRIHRLEGRIHLMVWRMVKGKKSRLFMMIVFLIKKENVQLEDSMYQVVILGFCCTK